MADTAAPLALRLPVDAETLDALHQLACIVCGATDAPLRPAGWRTTTCPDGSQLGWAVAACPDHAPDEPAGAEVTTTPATDTYPAYVAAMRLMFALDEAGIEPEGARGIAVDGRALVSVTFSRDAEVLLTMLLAPFALAAAPADADAEPAGLARALAGTGLTLWVEQGRVHDQVRLRGEPEAVQQLAEIVSATAR
jgi:hypothetical protein